MIRQIPLETSKEYYINKGTAVCTDITIPQFQFLVKNNFLSEYQTEEEKLEVLKNLGLFEKLFDILLEKDKIIFRYSDGETKEFLLKTYDIDTEQNVLKVYSGDDIYYVNVNKYGTPKIIYKNNSNLEIEDDDDSVEFEIISKHYIESFEFVYENLNDYYRQFILENDLKDHLFENTLQGITYKDLVNDKIYLVPDLTTDSITMFGLNNPNFRLWFNDQIGGIKLNYLSITSSDIDYTELDGDYDLIIKDKETGEELSLYTITNYGSYYLGNDPITNSYTIETMLENPNDSEEYTLLQSKQKVPIMSIGNEFLIELDKRFLYLQVLNNKPILSATLIDGSGNSSNALDAFWSIENENENTTEYFFINQMVHKNQEDEWINKEEKKSIIKIIFENE